MFMKPRLIVVLLALCAFKAKSQCIFIYANEKIKGVEIPIVNEEFRILINDTIQHVRRTKSDGSLGRIALEKGTYKVKIINPDFTEGFKSDVIVGDRTTDVEILLSRAAGQKTEEKKK